jgi:hypothetical protein
MNIKLFLISLLKNIKINNSAVVITGDLLNSKNRITSNEIILARNFIFNISQICPLVLIPGKTDKYENIMAIITNGNLPLHNINFLKEKGNYLLNNINFSYLTDNNFTYIDTKQTNIGLYYGGVGHYDLYNGKHTSSKVMKLKHFDKCDYSLLGGIHKHQFIDVNKRMVYAGTMIQKDYNEDWINHGYVLLDIKNNTINHHHLENNYRFVKFKILDEQLMTPIRNLPNNLYVTWDITETGNGMEEAINKIQNDIKEKFNVIEEKFNYNSFNKLDVNDTQYTFDLSIEKQKEYAIDWLKSNGIILEDQTELFKLIEKYNDKIKNTQKPFIKWKLLKIEFENILCYRKKQNLNFENLKGIQGIIAENNAGKSALFDILTFSIFGKSSRTDTYSYNDLFNTPNKILSTSVTIRDPNNTFVIKRNIIDKKLKISVEKNGIIIHENSVREATNYIISLLGTYDDFMTTTFMAQNNLHNFLLMTGKTQKDFTSRVFQLDIYDKIHTLLKNDSKYLKKEIKELEEKIKSFDEKNIIETITEIKNKIKLFSKEKEKLIQDITNSNNKKNKLELKPLLKDNDKTPLLLLKNKLEQINIDDEIINIEELQNELNNLNEKEVKNNLWETINVICNKLKELRGKKIKVVINDKPKSYEKCLKKINKSIKSAEDFLKENIDIHLLKNEIDKLNVETKIYFNIEKIKNNYNINSLIETESLLQKLKINFVNSLLLKTRKNLYIN